MRVLIPLSFLFALAPAWACESPESARKVTGQEQQAFLSDLDQLRCKPGVMAGPAFPDAPPGPALPVADLSGVDVTAHVTRSASLSPSVLVVAGAEPDEGRYVVTWTATKAKGCVADGDLPAWSGSVSPGQQAGQLIYYPSVDETITVNLDLTCTNDHGSTLARVSVVDGREAATVLGSAAHE